MSTSSLYLIAANTFGSHLLKAQKAMERKEWALGLFHARICEVAASFCDDSFPEEVTKILKDFGHDGADSVAGGQREEKQQTKVQK